MNAKMTALLVIALIIPVVQGASIGLSSPNLVMQGDANTLLVSLSSSSPFNGTLYVHYTNLNISDDIIQIENEMSKTITRTFRAINPGQYSVSADLIAENGAIVETKQFSGDVESSAPKILSKYPSGIISSDTVTLEITTNENAICRYGTANADYENLPKSFETTGEKVHKQNINSLSKGTQKYYVRCQDLQGYKMDESEIITFTIDLPPYAEIILSDSSPLTEGVITVTLIPSEDIQETPKLEYSFDTSPGSKRLVSLTEKDGKWTGYMIITNEDDNKVGTFYFSGTNKNGIIGNIIKEGKIFVVDTKKPPTPINIEAKPTNDGRIELNWYYEGEEVDYFRIYRSTSSGVNYLDFYSETGNITKFVDYSTQDKTTYYYKINAFDKAGNPSELSNEVYATSVKSSSKEKESVSESKEEAPKVLPPNLVYKVNDEIKRIETLLIDIEDISSSINEEEEKEIVEYLELNKKIDDAKTTLEKLKKDIESLKDKYMTEAQLDNEISKFDLEIKKIMQTTPRSIKVIQKDNTVQSLSEGSIDLAIDKLFENPGFESIKKDSYKKQNIKIQENIEILASLYNIEIDYIDNSMQEKSLILKSLSYKGSSSVKDVILYEIIPKSIAESSSDISFLTKNYEVIEDDPIVKFGFAEVGFTGQEIRYLVNKRVSMNDVKNSASVALVGPVQLEQDMQGVTGFSILNMNLGFQRRDIFFIIIGVLVIGALVGY
ncbi:MAG: fibronectin type III domain-containing protein, partial [Candidatus Nanoarchaeia archaeon]|nr:fibronectin type III domain-containing protein [Candidatus Nanoarchaeia archaeon]